MMSLLFYMLSRLVITFRPRSKCLLISWLHLPSAVMKLKDAYSLESYDQPRQHIKSRDITLSTKVCLVKAMVFPVVMYECECWTVKKAEHRRIDAFDLWF